MKTEYKFIKFENEGGIWRILNKKNGALLGRIGNYPQWKKHVLETVQGVVFSTDCLEDVIDFIEQLEEQA